MHAIGNGSLFSPSRRCLTVVLLFASLAALPWCAAQAAKKDKTNPNIPPRQREYQVVLRPKAFENRKAGVERFIEYIEALEDSGFLKDFKFKRNSGKDHRREAVFFDTRDGDFSKRDLVLRFRRRLDDGNDSHAELTIKHNAPSEAKAWITGLGPSIEYLQANGKFESKIELDLYEPGNSKYGYSVTLHGKRFRSQLAAPEDLGDLRKVEKMLPELVKLLRLPATTPLTITRHEYRWTRDEIDVTLAKKKCHGTLSLAYKTKQEMEDGTSAPTRIEFSWRLKQGKNEWKKKVFRDSGKLLSRLWRSTWAVSTKR